MSGVYIKGMEMPEDEETVTLTICADGLVFEEFKEPGDVFHAVHVPPHGRLIDADELVERIEGIWDCNDMTFRPDDHICDVPSDCKGCKWAQTVDCIKRMVENARTIIPAEEEK